MGGDYLHTVAICAGLGVILAGVSLALTHRDKHLSSDEHILSSAGWYHRLESPLTSVAQAIDGADDVAQASVGLTPLDAARLMVKRYDTNQNGVINLDAGEQYGVDAAGKLRRLEITLYNREKELLFEASDRNGDKVVTANDVEQSLQHVLYIHADSATVLPDWRRTVEFLREPGTRVEPKDIALWQLDPAERRRLENPMGVTQGSELAPAGAVISVPVPEYPVSSES